MNIDGDCHCGAITFTVIVDPERVVICHCTDCQAMSGAPYRVNVPVSAENLSLSGQPQRYVKTGSSGAKVVTLFCGVCGSPICSQRADRPDVFNLRLGGVRQRALLIPKWQGFCESALPWSSNISAVPRVAGRPTKSAPG